MLTQTLTQSQAHIGSLGSTESETQSAATDSLSDRQLVRLSASGDLAAFEIIYRRHHRRVYSLCLRLLRNPTEAEDLTQDAFVQLFRKLVSFRGEAAFSTWFYRLTFNQVVMYMRKRKYQSESPIEDSNFDCLSEVEGGRIVPLPVIEHIALEEAIKQLPRGYKEVFLLFDVEGHDHQEIGRILGISVGTSKSQLHKARMSLRRLLRKKAGTESRTNGNCSLKQGGIDRLPTTSEVEQLQ